MTNLKNSVNLIIKNNKINIFNNNLTTKAEPCLWYRKNSYFFNKLIYCY